IFNLLGPLTNPAGASRQVVGVNRPDLTAKLARVLQQLGTQRAMVVHGLDGLCELTISGPSQITELLGQQLRTYNVDPAELGLPTAPLKELLIDSPQASARAVQQVLDGQSGPRRNIVLLNAAAALVVAGLASDLPEGIDRAARAIDTGAARQTLELWTRTSHGR
ncbi:MAG: anthranilate phosphoribosyltransferase, partial [Phycisphaerae bacterium]